MCQLPIEIADAENVVRVILCPSHVKVGSNVLKPAAFRSRANTDEVSVVRQTHMGSDFCKQKGLSIQKLSITEYSGLAFVKAKAIKDCGSSVRDSREEYCGHAHISHGVVLEPNEPPQSDLNRFITERCRNILKATVYYPDPDPIAPIWTGPDF